MAPFNKHLEEERKKNEPKIEEGKEPTEEQREKINQLRSEENLKKIREFDRLIKEAPKFTYNTNVFKNVKLAMPEEEQKQDQKLVEDLAVFLKEQCLDKLIKQFE